MIDELPNLKERDFVHTRIKGTPDMIPAYPTIYEMLAYKNVASKEQVIYKKPTRKTYMEGFRDSETGDGKCVRCLKFKSADQFATKTGFVCKKCASEAKRIRRKKS